mmetsp:Transcript_42309/g.84109  ORF Transcript_42309/g.84109 Transcript_42309/m.84109 type:complete len:213 (-) Transcript_42309:16-654(-)
MLITSSNGGLRTSKRCVRLTHSSEARPNFTQCLPQAGNILLHEYEETGCPFLDFLKAALDQKLNCLLAITETVGPFIIFKVCASPTEVLRILDDATEKFEQRFQSWYLANVVDCLVRSANVALLAEDEIADLDFAGLSPDLSHIAWISALQRHLLHVFQIHTESSERKDRELNAGLPGLERRLHFSLVLLGEVTPLAYVIPLPASKFRHNAQ